MNAREARLLVHVVMVLVGLQLATSCLAAGGDADATFADNGVFVYPRAPSSSAVTTRQVLAMSHGRLLALGGVGGGPTGSASYQSSASFALTNTGALDRTFGTNGLLPDLSTNAHGFLTAQELANGSLVFASQVLACPSPAVCVVGDPGPTYRVQRYLSTGTPDTGYGQAGTHSTASHVGNAAILADGTAIGLGVTYSHFVITELPDRPYSFDAVVVDATGQSNSALAAQFLTQMIRCSPSGTADVSSLAAPVAPVVQRTPDDRIIFAYGPCLLKMNPDATPDNTFGSGGLSQVDNAGLRVLQVLILKDGSVLTFSLLADGSTYRVVKRLSTGSPDPTFGVGGVVAAMALPFTPIATDNSVPNTRGLLALDTNGRVLIAGSKVDPVTNAQASYLARFDAQMNLDTSFGGAGTGLATLGNSALGLFTPSAVTVDDMDRIVVGGRLRFGDSATYLPQYAEAVVRLEGDPILVPVSSGGGCFSVRNQQVDPTLWGLVAFALIALWSRGRRMGTPNPREPASYRRR